MGRETSMCGCLSRTPSLGTWPTTQACALIGNRTGNPLVHRLLLKPLSHTSQGYFWCNCTWDCFLSFPFSQFIIGVEKCNWFLDIYFVTWYFSEFIYQFLQGFGGIIRVLCIQYHVICKYWQFSSFQFGCLLLLWLGLPVLCWVRVVKGDFPVLFPILRENGFSSCPLSMMLPGGLSYMFPVFPLCWVFIINEY